MKKDRSKSKVNDPTINSPGDHSRVSRGGRNGVEGTRGRGRGTDRGGRGGRGRGAAQINGSHKEKVESSVPTSESSAWDTTATKDVSAETPAWETAKASGEDSWGSTAAVAATSTAAVAAKVTSSIIPDGVKKSWASMFAAPAPAPKKAPEPVEKYVLSYLILHLLIKYRVEPTTSEEVVDPPTAELELPASEPEPVEPVHTPVETPAAAETEAVITPSKDELTEDNLDQIPDVSAPAPSATAASTAASSWDPRNGPSTPYSALQQNQPQAVRPASGFQASALKATGPSGRTPSYQRRVLDQEEAVRMPGNREVDRAAVQFGAFNLNGSGDEDVDGDREEPETRAQPPQHSPVAHPRAALPPAPQQATPVPEAFPTPKQATGLPAAHPTSAPGLPSPQPLASVQNTQGPQGNSQYGRYGPAGVSESSLPPKPFDAFSQQAPSAQSPFEGYPGQQGQSQSQAGAFSSAPNEFSSYYTADPQQRNAFNNYYQQQYGLQQGAQGQDGSAPQRSYSGYGGPQNEAAGSQFPQSAAQQNQSRFATAGEGQTSGHTTPNPAAQTQQPGTTQGRRGHQV